MGERFQRTVAAATAKREVLRVKRIQVEGLFGLYNHDIPLNADDRVTIIHGPNGVGKTVLLKMIAAVFGGNFEELVKAPFRNLSIEFVNGARLLVAPTKVDEIHDKDEGIVEISYHSDKAKWDNRIEVENDAMLWFDAGITSSIFGDIAPPPPQPKHAKTKKKVTGVPKWLEQLRTIFHVHFIETQRLLRTNASDPSNNSSVTIVPTVHEYAEDLHIRIRDALATYATESQTIDQSFPQRLLKIKGSASIDPVELKQRLTTLNNKRAQFETLGLLETTAASPVEVESMDASDPAQRNVISLYIEDTQQKLAVLDDIARRITLFLEYVNGKFRNKSIQISRENGFIVLGHDGQPIEPDALSSGEQHELVQLYDLLFRVKRGTLVLIDEPELSLHVLWQKRYLSELIQIAKTAEFDAIVATHSPFIVGDRSDLAVALDADIDT